MRCYCPHYSWIRGTQSKPNLFFTWHDSYIYINCFFGLTGSALFLVLTYWESVQRLATGRQTGVRSPVGAWAFPFSRSVQMGSGVHPPSQSMRTRVPSRGKAGRGGGEVQHYLHLAPRTRKGGALLLLPSIYLHSVDRNNSRYLV